MSFTDKAGFYSRVLALCRALSQYLLKVSQLPSSLQIPSDKEHLITTFTCTSTEVKGPRDAALCSALCFTESASSLISFFTLAPNMGFLGWKMEDRLAPLIPPFKALSPSCFPLRLRGIWRPGHCVAPAPQPAALECRPAVGHVLSVSGPAAALCLEQAVHPRVHHPDLLPHLLPTPHYCCRYH